LLVEVLHDVLLVFIYRGFTEGYFGNLALVDFVLESVCGDQSVDYNVSFLADSVESVDRLVVVRRVPVWI
jgi:hypothetical protein